MQKIKELLKHRGILSVLVAVIAGLAGYNVETVTEWEFPAIKVEVTNWPATPDHPQEPVEDLTPVTKQPWPKNDPNNKDPKIYNPPIVEPGIEVPAEEILDKHGLRVES